MGKGGCTYGVDSHAAVEIFLRGAHLDSDAEALHHLVTTLAEDMQTDDLLVGAFAHDLELRGFFLLLFRWETVEQLWCQFVVFVDFSPSLYFLQAGIWMARSKKLTRGNTWRKILSGRP